MDEKVVNLRGESIALPGEVVPEVVELLEQALAEAKAGEIVAFAAVKVSKDFEPMVGWQHKGTRAVGNALVAGVADLAYRVAKNRCD